MPPTTAAQKALRPFAEGVPVIRSITGMSVIPSITGIRSPRLCRPGNEGDQERSRRRLPPLITLEAARP
jgi:hypothetical protein